MIIQKIVKNKGREIKISALILCVLIIPLSNDLAFPDGTRFYPDKQNGKYGFNTSPTRGADTFYPFFKIRNFSLTIPCHITAYSKEYNISLKIVVKDGVLTGTWTNLTILQEIITRGTNFTENLRDL